MKKLDYIIPTFIGIVFFAASLQQKYPIATIGMMIISLACIFIAICEYKNK